jgi:hypothetical protein
VYDGSEMCLNPGCTDFWKTNGKEPGVLNYSEKFLRLQPRTFDSLPTLIPTGGTQPTASSHLHSRGWHCISCGRLSCRFGFPILISNSLLDIQQNEMGMFGMFSLSGKRSNSHRRS